MFKESHTLSTLEKTQHSFQKSPGLPPECIMAQGQTNQTNSPSTTSSTNTVDPGEPRQTRRVSVVQGCFLSNLTQRWCRIHPFTSLSPGHPTMPVDLAGHSVVNGLTMKHTVWQLPLASEGALLGLRSAGMSLELIR
ncbi:hypothetical protein Bbelb_043290 [Branchiostoma belcheri]|nr:hypothetical protein Bbelb_043290 [Branchiostoma belcheri]